ncbi:hypothetical protein HDV05_004459 [Chytridiales sp. JEL 0842]|nr:hypothetical protein HDV05_004459 [Chytridiales sp. JEL 0842]
MIISTILSLAIGVHLASARLALEPPAGKIAIGAWYSRPLNDTPASVNARISPYKLSFYQIDIDISGDKPDTPAEVVDTLRIDLENSGTDANAYVTVYPFKGFSDVTDAQLDDLVNRLKKIMATNREVLLRYAPEMNGSWFIYGGRPSEFKQSWIKVYTYVRSKLTTQENELLAFLWAPNSGNGYPYELFPFQGGFTPYPIGSVNGTESDATRIREMDTNGNGLLDADDDPYLPFYPGDEYVDWVGLSIYHYGVEHPWHQNVIPESNKFEGYLQGNVKPEWGRKPFYTYFSSTQGVQNITKGDKPFFLAETGVAYHYAWRDETKAWTDPLPPRLGMKQTWWRSFLNTEFLAKYPNFKAACFFEFVKGEEDTERDFSNFGAPPNGDVEEGKVVAAGFVEDAKEWGFVEWGKERKATVSTATVATKTATATASVTPTSGTGKMEVGGVVGALLGFASSILLA